MSKAQLSDSEEPPPSYYDDYGARKGGGLEDSDADPYAFEITSSEFPIPTKEVEDSADYSDEEYEKTNEKNDSEDEYEGENSDEELKSSGKNALPKGAPISMQDRIAQILQRTGSQQFQPDKSEDEEISGEDSDEKINIPVPKATTDEKAKSFEKEEQESDGNYSDSGRSSLSDSLGVGSSDFEVKLPARPSGDRTRLSMSSLDSEKFAVNRDALTSELATPSRYEQHEMVFLKSQQDEDSSGEKDAYKDDEFELDHTLIEGNKETSPVYSPVHEAEGESLSRQDEESLVSEQDNVKSLLQVDPVSAPTEDYVAQVSEAQNSPVYSSLSGDSQEKYLDGSTTFGYGEDEFEETERSRLEEETISKIEDQTGVEAVQDESAAVPDVESTIEYSADYEDDGFEEETITQNDTPKQEPLEVITEDKQETVNDPVNQNSKLDALMAKYGDFYTEEEEEEDIIANESSNEPKATQEVQDETSAPAIPDKESMPDKSRPLPVSIETPDSPPPPPPPADDDEDDEELHKFMLDTPSSDAKNQAHPVLTQQSVLQSQPLSTVDKFRQIENHVASLRFLQPSLPDLSAANSPSIVHPVAPKVLAGNAAVIPPPVMEPMSISFDAGHFIEDEDAQREIDEFVRSSQIMRKEKQVAAQRASVARENGLVLRLQQAQRQIIQLKEHIQTIANDPVQTGGGEADKEQQDKNEPTSAAYAELQKEIKTQDALIAAFQKENERLMQQFKQVRQDVRYDVHEANEELRRQIKTLQDQLEETATLGGGSDLTSKAQYRVAVEARLEAEAHAMALQEELASVRLAHQQKLNEVTLELDRVKKAKVELECRYEGVDLTQVAQESQHARELQAELELSKKEHTHALAALQKKLDWYVENQRLLDDQDEELRRLRGQITATPEPMPSKNQRVKPEAAPARGYRRSPADIRRIQELEGRLADLEEAMRKRHPDSLSNLILASRRADEESKTRALETNYEDKMAALSLELEQAHEKSETKLKSFRQQQEKLLLQYRRKIKEQEKQLKQLTKTPLTHRPTSKDTVSTSSDTELVKVRRFYTDKIKEVERKWEAKYRSLRKHQYSGLSSNQKEGLTYADAAVVIANLQRQLREQELELKQEKAKVERLGTEDQDPIKEDNQSKIDTGLELKEQVEGLKTQLEESESARAKLAQTLTTIQTLGLARSLNSDPTPAVEPAVIKQLEAELAHVKQDLTEARDTLARERATASEKIERLEKQVTDHVEKKAVLEAQFTGNQRELESFRKQALEADRHHRTLEILAQRVPDLEEEVLALRRELELPRTPSMVQYRSLELQVATLEQKHKLRESELKVVLDRALASTRLEQLSRERAHQAAIAAKNDEISSFKHQLEEILDELAQLQLNPPTKNQKQPEDSEYLSW